MWLEFDLNFTIDKYSLFFFAHKIPRYLEQTFYFHTNRIDTFEFHCPCVNRLHVSISKLSLEHIASHDKITAFTEADSGESQRVQDYPLARKIVHQLVKKSYLRYKIFFIDANHCTWQFHRIPHLIGEIFDIPTWH